MPISKAETLLTTGLTAIELDKDIRNLKVLVVEDVALTADITENDLAQCKAVGMNDHITKTIYEKLLYNKIIELVKK